MTNKFSKEYIQALLAREDNIGMHAIGRALVVLHNNQTETEKHNEQTYNNNGVGFTPADAYMGSAHAKYYIRFNKLTEKQIQYWQRKEGRGNMRIGKYWRQLIEAAKEKEIQKMKQEA